MNGKKYEKLTITCRTNEDWNGVWTRSEVRAEMMECGIEDDDSAWEWVINHVFDSVTSFGPIGYDMLCKAIENGTVCSITLMLGENKVKIEQS